MSFISRFRCSVRDWPPMALGLAWVACASPPPAETPSKAPPAVPSSEAQHPQPPATERKIVSVEDVRASGSFLAPLPQAVTSFGAAATRTHLFVAGGYFGTPHRYSKEGQSQDLWALGIEEPGAWEKIGQLDQGLQGLAAVAHEQRVCVFGGNHASNAEGSPATLTSVPDARCFDTQSRTWSQLPPMPEGRSSHGAALIDDTVYIVGGWTLTGSPSSGTFATDVLTLDLDDPEADWKRLPCPFQRRALGVTRAGRHLVVVGGMTAEGDLSTAVDIYDPESKEWRRGPDHPGDAFGIAIAGGTETLYASGREGLLRSLDLNGKRWATLRSLALPRFFHEMRLIDDQLAILGGIAGMHTRGRTRTVEKLPLDGSLAFGQMDFSWPGDTKNRQGYLSQGTLLYLFGGNRSLGQHDFSTQDFSAKGWIFDLATLDFHEAAPFPVPRQSMQTLPTGAGGLALGGFGHEPQAQAQAQAQGDSQAISHREIFSYSWEDDAWREAGSLPRGRTQFGATEGDESFWILGGLNYDPARKRSFDHDQAIWVSPIDDLAFGEADVRLPGPRRAFAGAALDGKYYLVGGMKENFQLVEDCLSFDFDSKSFETIPCPEPRLSGDLVAAGGLLYLVGGSVLGTDGIEESRTIEVFDPQKKTWTTLDFEIPLSTRHMRALAVRDNLLLVSTYYEDKRMTVGLLSPPNAGSAGVE